MAKEWAQRVVSNAWAIPIALLAVCALSYGSMASWLGVYWDDWTILYYIHFLGPASFMQAFAVDRPLLGAPYVLTTSLLGESPLMWQMFGMFARWLSCLALWWALRALWPGRALLAATATLLFAVYPGFNQQYIAITYGNGFLFEAIFFFSLGLMLLAVRRPARPWGLYAVSIVLSGYVMFSVEYFFGLELLRPLLLWLALSEAIPDVRRRIRRVGLYWIPYAILILFFLAWRVSTPTPRGQITLLRDLSEGRAAAVFELAKTVGGDVLQVSALAWRKALDVSTLAGYEPVTILKYSLIVLGAAGLATLALALLSKAEPHDEGDARRRAWQAMGLGLCALLLGGAPIWATNLQMELFFPWDRFTLPMMAGVSLLLAGLIGLLPGARRVGVVVVGIAVGLAAGWHFQVALTYRVEWLTQRDFFWQLAWRAPGIQPGTMLLTTEMPFLYDTDNSLSAPLNWIYAPQNRSYEFAYLLYDVEARLSSGLPPLEEGDQLREFHRTMSFTGLTSQAILVDFRPPACLRVIDPARDRRLPDKPRYYRQILPFSRPDLILPYADPAAQLPVQLFPLEPEHGWCYYFEKAELARQASDWERVAALGDQALAGENRIYRGKVAELLPFIEGYAHTGRWQEAVDLSIEAYQIWENMRLPLCDTWALIQQSSAPDSEGQAAFEVLRETLQCGLSK
ncbi:MAG: hypothetical protein JXA78_18180 [Anaerolineales bacterium]|nr:hypothetical protein [Anaerolineales bacterium]